MTIGDNAGYKLTFAACGPVAPAGGESSLSTPVIGQSSERYIDSISQ